MEIQAELVFIFLHFSLFSAAASKTSAIENFTHFLNFLQTETPQDTLIFDILYPLCTFIHHFSFKNIFMFLTRIFSYVFFSSSNFWQYPRSINIKFELNSLYEFQKTVTEKKTNQSLKLTDFFLLYWAEKALLSL